MIFPRMLFINNNYNILQQRYTRIYTKMQTLADFIQIQSTKSNSTGDERSSELGIFDTIFTRQSE